MTSTSTSERHTRAYQDAGKQIQANGIDIHYVEDGEGEPLVLLHGGMVSTNPLWAGVPVAYVSQMATFAEHFRVIAPDTRGAGKTANPGGDPISSAQLADDVAALIDALGLGQPAICGFSDGGVTATLVGIRHPDAVSAIVNDAGFDLFNPKSHSFQIMRQMLGGNPNATQADPDAMEQFFSSSDQMRGMFELMKADHDGGQGTGYWKTYITEAFGRAVQSPGYTFEDLRSITAPTLILTGDRDMFCSVEDAIAAYRMLQNGELAIIPGLEHIITPAKVQTTIDFIKRHADSGPHASSSEG
jgi:pimeloyl-ACP methyl ester carboxylesterase